MTVASRTYRSRAAEQATDQTQMQVRLSTVVRERLRNEADRRAVSVNLLVERAIEDALTRWEKQKLP